MVVPALGGFHLGVRYRKQGIVRGRISCHEIEIILLLIRKLAVELHGTGGEGRNIAGRCNDIDKMGRIRDLEGIFTLIVGLGETRSVGYDYAGEGLPFPGYLTLDLARLGGG